MLQRLIYFYFVYLVFEGALRKWFLPGLSQELFLLKDLILGFGAFVLLAQATQYRNLRVTNMLERRDVLIWGMWVFYICGHLFVTGFSLTGLIGLRYYLVMLPILLLLPLAIQDMEHLNVLVLKYYYLAIPVCLLGVVQFLSPASSRINSYAWTSGNMAIATLGENTARITGTFSYISPYAVYLQCMLLLGLCLLLSPRSHKERLVISASTALILANTAMTGSRAPFVVAGILAVPLLLKLSARKEVKQFSTVVSVVLMVALLFLFADPFSLLAERHKHSGDTEQRIAGTFLIPYYTLKTVSFVGKGVGSTFGGLSEATGDAQTDDSGFEEVTMDRIGIEIGLLGYLLMLLTKFTYLVGTYQFYRKSPWDDIRNWSLVSLLIQLSMLWTIPVYNSLAAAYYFASLAIFFKLRLFARERCLESAQ